jgi:hypothetical protein
MEREENKDEIILKEKDVTLGSVKACTNDCIVCTAYRTNHTWDCGNWRSLSNTLTYRL